MSRHKSWQPTLRQSVGRQIPVYEPDGKPHTTINQALAMANGYFGEVLIVPRHLANEISYILTGRVRYPFYLYYYGTPDLEMRKRFNLEGWL